MHDHSSMMDHSHSHPEPDTSPKEYVKFAGVIIGIFIASYIIAELAGDVSIGNYLRMFMGTFFLAFGLFKLLDLPGFAMSFRGYDIIAKRLAGYAYLVPFLEITLALGYFFAVPFVDWATVVLTSIGAVGVFKELVRGSKIKCACLGTFIKLPLTTISLVEYMGMGIMALLMIARVI